MKEYIKYQHIEKLGNDEVEGITEGTCYIFPKIDGTNSQVWKDEDGFHCGSRNRELSLEEDNAGFMAYATQHHNLVELANRYPGFHFFGEWLVPHSLKTYNPSNWRKFYIFDVMDDNGKYLPYEEYSGFLANYPDVEYIPPIRILKNPQDEHLIRCLDENTYLIDDGNGVGEGIVIKNYSYANKYGRQTWAKMVTNEFKEKHTKEMGAPMSSCADFVEEQIVNEFLTQDIADKVVANILTEKNTGWRAQYIAQFLGTVYHDFVTETIWAALKKYKNPKIDFKRLQRFAIIKAKELRPDLF